MLQIGNVHRQAVHAPAILAGLLALYNKAVIHSIHISPYYLPNRAVLHVMEATYRVAML